MSRLGSRHFLTLAATSLNVFGSRPLCRYMLRLALSHAQREHRKKLAGHILRAIVAAQ